VSLNCVQVVEDGYEFFAKRQLVTLFSAPNYCGEFDNAGAMMSVDETLMCSFQVRKRQNTGFLRSWKTWESHGILKWSFPGLEQSWKKLKSQKFWKSHGNV